ncbi:MAG: AAA family ATPase [Armatimonadetes bacterium CG2_30_59_28]|nr:MAG: AAA family ATPase [Armatimonadetes bacterium CG2_30_59_28]PIU61906.1 MAG: AAA family ATPase [Armatimonadetes bacterium CG07_land_8_20_14_0_80_59_28]PIX40782.1 MAG: AAA family ATPase [Armatimonadetes bacterium CG_4_8_14_3_um_filter_58_9]
MVVREMQAVLLRLAGSYPVVTVTGPRQSGKTTLCRMAFPDRDYVSLESVDQRQFATDDPRGFLAQFPKGAVLDEVQRVPDLLSYIQTTVDERNRSGQYILTGSAQFELMDSVSQSLAGRTALLRLLPFTLEEAYLGRDCPEIDSLLWRGFYPRIHDHNLNPSEALSFYFDTYVERDLRSLLNVRDLSQFERFVQLCAGRTGQILNLTGLGSDCGVTHNTARAWLSVLETSYLVYLLKPHARNLGRRLVRSPKLYFVDVGLATFLLGVEEPSQLTRHPLRGALFETFVVSEMLKQRFNRGLRSNLFFFRDSAGHEVDLLLESGQAVYLIEIKAGQTVASDFFRGLNFYRSLNSDSVAGMGVLYGGERCHTRQDTDVFGCRDIPSLYQSSENALREKTT